MPFKEAAKQACKELDKESHTMTIDEQKALFDIDSELSENEAFEALDREGIDEITWSKSLDEAYAQWMYFNLK